MAELEYSNKALEVKCLFYNKKITVYVEGKDDPPFWRNLFSLADIEARIESVGGKNELDKYIDKIINEDAGFYVATDDDNSEFTESDLQHEKVIRTYGYSIENSMYHYLNPIEKTISEICRKQLDLSTDFNTWVTEFSKKVYELIVYDIANNKYGKGISIFGDNCYKFLKSRNSHEICTTKIQKFLVSKKDKFSAEEINAVKESINQSEKDLWFLIKGHFITNALINFIKRTIKKEIGTNKTMTLDFLYSITIDCKENWENRIDIKTVVEKLKEINKSA